MYRKIRNFIFSNSFTPILLLLLCILSYALLAPAIGYFLDDWYLIWFKHTFGALQYIQYFSSDRPLMGFFYVALNFLLGGSEKPLLWQIIGVFTRWLVSIAFWQMLNTIWPQARKQNTWTAVLAAVFPGFTQQWIAYVYSFFFFCLAGFFFSVTLMLKAIRAPKKSWLYTLASVLIMAYVIPASEFYVGLELVRVLILWFEYRGKSSGVRERTKKTAFTLIPYALVYAIFLIWRVFFYRSVNHPLALNTIFSGGTIQVLTNLATRVYQTVVDAVVNSWANPFNLNNYPSSGTTFYLIVGLVILAFSGLLVWQKKTFSTLQSESAADEENWHRQAPALAIAALLVAIIPFLAADLTIDYHFPNDRFLLAFLMGSCLLLVWAVESAGRNEIKTIILVSLLAAVGMGYQISNASFYKNLTAIQDKLYWQIYWRMPSLKPGTTLMAYQMPDTEYWSGNALSSQINWTYSNKVENRQIDYLFILLNSGQETLIHNLQKDVPIQYDFRTYSFSGNTSQSIFLYYSTDGCMRVLDSKLTPAASVLDDVADANLFPEDPRVQSTIAGSNLTSLNLIGRDETAIPLVNIVGKEPPHDWCYYFEKADLARQYGDYQGIKALYQQVADKGLSSKIGSEYYPFIDGLARSGNWQEAADLTLKQQPITTPALQTGLCFLWQNLAADFPSEDAPSQVMSQLKCSISSTK